MKAMKQEMSVRPFREVDVQFVVDSHLSFYAEEYGFTSEVWQNYVRDGVQALVNQFDPTRDCFLILEREGTPCGSIAITHTGQDTAQLRFFLVSPAGQGKGAGHLLLDEAIAFSQTAGYKQVFLWTFSDLGAARHLYSSKGFTPTETQENNDWGTPVVEERWDLTL